MIRKYTLENGLFTNLLNLDIQPEEVLKKAELPTSLIQSQRALLTVDEYYRLWDAILSIKQDVDFPIQLIKAISSDLLSPPVFAALCSPNFAVAIDRLKRYKSLIGPMLVNITYDQKQNTIITLSGLPHDPPMPYSLSIIDLLFTLYLIRAGTQKPIKPVRVELAHSIADTDTKAVYKDFFGVPVVSSMSNRIVFSHASMTTPFVTVNENLWQVFEPELKKNLKELDESVTLTEKVYSCLLDIIASGDTSLRRVSSLLAVSPRTLQRRLKHEKTSFQSLLVSVRKELSEHYLLKTEYSHQEIAFLLGFHDSNSFYRAFKDWTGITPDSYTKTIKTTTNSHKITTSKSQI